MKCTFAFPGTYGHECGKPATLASKRESGTTKNGIFWALRCDSCAKIKGGENRDFDSFEAINETKHRNVWR